VTRIAAAGALAAALSGCALPSAPPREESPCVTQGEASYDCQIEHYNKVNAG
jgi:hypothetical protein